MPVALPKPVVNGTMKMDMPFLYFSFCQITINSKFFTYYQQ